MGDFKFFEGIYELRIDYGPGYRIYYGKKDKTFVLLLLGGSKASQRKDIDKAQFWEDQKRSPLAFPLKTFSTAAWRILKKLLAI